MTRLSLAPLWVDLLVNSLAPHNSLYCLSSKDKSAVWERTLYITRGGPLGTPQAAQICSNPERSPRAKVTVRLLLERRFRQQQKIIRQPNAESVTFFCLPISAQKFTFMSTQVRGSAQKTIRYTHNAESHEPDLSVQTVPLASI